MIISESTYVAESSINLFYFMATQYGCPHLPYAFAADGQVVSVESSVEMTLRCMFLFA